MPNATSHYDVNGQGADVEAGVAASPRTSLAMPTATAATTNGAAQADAATATVNAQLSLAVPSSAKLGNIRTRTTSSTQNSPRGNERGVRVVFKVCVFLFSF